MVVEKDIVAISIPFSAGVIMAAQVPPGSDLLWPVAGGACLAAAALLCLACRPGHRNGTLAGLFFLLGVFCGANAALSFAPPVRADFAGRALSGLARSIEGAGFSHENTAELLKALLTGNRDGMDRGTVAAFRTAGASHLLALSGLHLGILYGILQKGLSVLGRGRTALLVRSAAGIGASAFYLAMTGAPPSLVRAFLFICLHEASRLLPGRRRKPLSIFCAALTIQLAVSPGVVGSLGFQLSYLALLGIVLAFPHLEAWYPRSPHPDPFRKIWTATALTLSCQAFTAPLVWMHFHTFPRYFLLTNLGALPLTEAFILCGLPSLLPGCPAAIKNLADLLGQALIAFLETIASL